MGSAVCHSHAILCESLRLFIGYDQVDVSNLAGVEQIVRRIVQDERAVRKNPKHPDYSGLEFVLNQTVELANGGGRGRGLIPLPPPREAMTSSRSTGLSDDDCRPLRRGLGHRELVGFSHCRSLSSCQFAQIAFCPGIVNRDWFASRRNSCFFERV